MAKAIADVRDRSSIYWGFYDPDVVVGGAEAIEVRLNGPPEKVAGFDLPPGWHLHRVQWGDTLSLRRHQTLTEDAVEEMLIEMLRLAGARGLQLHSWMHGPDLDP